MSPILNWPEALALIELMATFSLCVEWHGENRQSAAIIIAKVAADGYAPWQLGQKQSIFGKSFRPFGLVEGENFKEYDLIHVAHALLFWGARNVDGRGFDSEANRPTNLQIPLVRE